MKKICILSSLLLISTTAFAKDIQLEPGSRISIAGDVITCLGNQELPPACVVKQNGTYSYVLMAGDVLIDNYSSLNDALEGVKKVKSTGLCR